MSFKLDILEKGYVSSRFGICCPDCEIEENKKIHILANDYDYLQMHQSAGCRFSGCCLNIYTTDKKFQEYLKNIVEPPKTLEITNIGSNVLAKTTGETACVNNNFYNCITQISGLCTDFSVFVNRGIFEVGTLSGTSAICILKNYIINNSLTLSEAQDLLSLFFIPSEFIYTKGMVTSCNNNEITIAYVDTWLKYYEAVGYVEFCRSQSLAARA